eukprot:TRINITY_DN8340_c0_g1_i1.p2 TRINITY_DN8340_c0_g1~~TRINITY_DN8340_c0_g1_i1.p2  ORF type:complete len:429 (-),score=162.18 TRINITY_DN8340_c0_g1_i1:307-1593(-)
MSIVGADKDVAEDVMEVFRAFDLNGDGKIGREELEAVLKTLDPKSWDESALDKLLSQADTNGDGTLQVTEFWAWLSTTGKDSGIDFDTLVEQDRVKRATRASQRQKKIDARDQAAAEVELKKQRAAEREAGGRFNKSAFIEERVAAGVSREVASGLFNKFDSDADGDIDTKEMKRLAAAEVNSAFQVKDLFRQSAAPKEGKLSKDNCDEQAMDQLMNTFKSWDADGNGVITCEELASIVRVLNPNMSDKVIEAMVKEADTSEDGEIDLEEFVVWLSGGVPKKKKAQEERKARIAATLHQQRSEEARRRGLQKQFEDVQHKALEGFMKAKKLVNKHTCYNLNHGPLCTKCREDRHIWVCHGCGFVSYFGSCVNGCSSTDFGWTCITDKCKGKRCGCKKDDSFWKRKGFAQDVDLLDHGLDALLEHAAKD